MKRQKFLSQLYDPPSEPVKEKVKFLHTVTTAFIGNIKFRELETEGHKVQTE